MLGSEYQRAKHKKHTLPSSSHPLQTVFDSNRTAYYDDCIRETYARGALEIDSRGTNLIFCPSTGSDIGSKYKWGKEASRQDTVIAVKTSDPTGVHAFLKASSQYSAVRCTRCGEPVLSFQQRPYGG